MNPHLTIQYLSDFNLELTCAYLFLGDCRDVPAGYSLDWKIVLFTQISPLFPPNRLHSFLCICQSSTANHFSPSLFISETVPSFSISWLRYNRIKTPSFNQIHFIENLKFPRHNFISENMQLANSSLSVPGNPTFIKSNFLDMGTIQRNILQDSILKNVKLLLG